MQIDFKLRDCIYLVKDGYEIDLHNDLNFEEVCYCVVDRRATLQWRRSTGKLVDTSTPASVRIEFFEVSEFRFFPRDPEMPFTEDDCLSDAGYWIDEEWCEGVMVTNETPQPDWLTAVGFMSGAMIAVQAARAVAVIEP